MIPHNIASIFLLNMGAKYILLPQTSQYKKSKIFSVQHHFSVSLSIMRRIIVSNVKSLLRKGRETSTGTQDIQSLF